MIHCLFVFVFKRFQISDSTRKRKNTDFGPFRWINEKSTENKWQCNLQFIKEIIDAHELRFVGVSMLFLLPIWNHTMIASKQIICISKFTVKYKHKKYKFGEKNNTKTEYNFSHDSNRSEAAARCVLLIPR